MTLTDSTAFGVYALHLWVGRATQDKAPALVHHQQLPSCFRWELYATYLSCKLAGMRTCTAWKHSSDACRNETGEGSSPRAHSLKPCPPCFCASASSQSIFQPTLCAAPVPLGAPYTAWASALQRTPPQQKNSANPFGRLTHCAAVMAGWASSCRIITFHF